MESRKSYNHSSAWLFSHARFHLFTICFWLVRWNLAWII